MTTIDQQRQLLSARHGSSILISDDNRLQAYGWSLSSRNQLKLSEINGKVQVNVPVPVYCRPIFNTNDTTQVNKHCLLFFDSQIYLGLVCCWY